jgi:hypothetical protein
MTAGFTGYDQAALYLSLSLSDLFLICLGLAPLHLIIRLGFPTLRFRLDLIWIPTAEAGRFWRPITGSTLLDLI